MLGIICLRSPGQRGDRNCHQYWLLMDFNLVAGSLGAIIAQYVIVGTGRNFFGAVEISWLQDSASISILKF